MTAHKEAPLRHMHTIVVSISGYDGDVAAGHAIIVEVGGPDGRRSAETSIELPAQEPTTDPYLWAKRVLSAFVADL